jgi:DNA-binding NarL/FixJ family response regulator
MKRADNMVRVILAEDHPVTRKGFLLIFGTLKGFKVAAEAGTADELWTALEQVPADLLVLDIYLREVNTLELIPRIRARYPNLKIVVISGFDDAVFVHRAIRRGANGFVSKLAGAQEFAKAVNAVSRGQIYVLGAEFESGAEKVFLASDLQRPEQDLQAKLRTLTLREIEVFRLLGQWKCAKEIAQILGMSPKTVEVHRVHIKKKLGVTSAAELVQLAVEWGQRSSMADKHV